LSERREVSALAPFRVRSYRFQWPSDLTTSWAFEMETLILGWYVLVATDSVLMLTIYGSLQFLGTLIAPMLGVAGDRIGRRAMLCRMRAFYTVQASVIMTLGITGHLSPDYVFAIAALMGLVRPSDIVMRNALVGDTMPRGSLMSAMSLTRTTQDSARIVGALAGAGLVAALGVGHAYIAVTAFYAASMLFTLGVSRIRPERSPTAPGTLPASPWRDLVEGLAYVWATPRVLALMLLAFLVNLTAFPLTTGLMPYIAREIYGIDAIGLGHLVAAYAGGALAGSIAMAASGGVRRSIRLMLLAVLSWYVLLIVFGHMGSKAAGLPVLVLVGAAQGIAMISMAVILLNTVSERLRGRIMGVRMLAVYGLPLGLLGAGVIIGQIGWSATVLSYVGVGLVGTLLVVWRWRAALVD
jgi:MFS family permease